MAKLPFGHHDQITGVHNRDGELVRMSAQLRAENARLLKLLNLTGAQAQARGPAQIAIFEQAPGAVDASSPAAAKVAFFRALLRARDDVYAVRWENRRDGRTGWMPAVRGGRLKGIPASQREYLPLNDDVVHEHLAGTIDIGLYPLLDRHRCCWLAADFDGPAAMLDALAYRRRRGPTRLRTSARRGGGRSCRVTRVGRGELEFARHVGGEVECYDCGMDHIDLLVDAVTRVRDLVHHTLDDLPAEHLVARLDAEANTIAWLIWHLTRVQDDHIAEVSGQDQVWLAAGWCDRFALPFDARAIGYGQSPAEVSQLIAGADLLSGYHDAVHARTVEFVRGLSSVDLDRIVDRRWNPPVTLGVRVVSVICDDLQHVGQAAYVRGVLSRR